MKYEYSKKCKNYIQSKSGQKLYKDSKNVQKYSPNKRNPLYTNLNEIKIVF